DKHVEERPKSDIDGIYVSIDHRARERNVVPTQHSIGARKEDGSELDCTPHDR
ncbi:jg4393, partial [Pararge aegeria aegeria]